MDIGSIEGLVEGDDSFIYEHTNSMAIKYAI